MARPPGSAIVDPKTGQITPEWLDFLSRDITGEGGGGITIIKPGPGGGGSSSGGGASGPVDASTLIGTTLAPNVIFSSLSSVGILTSGMLGPGFVVDFSLISARGQIPWTSLPSGSGTWSVGHVGITGVVSAQAFVGDGSGLTNLPLAAHALTHQAGGTDPIKLDALALPDDVITLNASSARHGLLPKLSGVASQYLNGQGQWTEPGSTGGGALAPHASTHMPGGTDVLTLSATARVLGRVSAGAGPVELLSYIDLPTTIPGPPVANVGRLHCLDINGYELFVAQDVTGADLILSRDAVTVVKVVGQPVARGQLVYISGASGANVEVQLARADVPGTLPAIGFALDAGSVNGFIRVMTAGKIGGIDTSLFTDGARLFVSVTNAGGVSTTPPPYPNYIQRVGVVTRAHATQGEVLVLISGGVRDQHAPSHETGGTDPITALAATVLTTGTLSDARLSPNVLTVPGGYPGSTGVFLRGDGTWAIPSGGAGGGPHHTTHEPGGSDPITALDASVLTTGTVNDARLSANVALRNAANVFTGVNQSNDHGWLFFETALAPNTRLWKIGPSGGTFYVSSMLDGGTTGAGGYVSITRDGTLEASKNLRASQDVYALNGAFYGSGIGLTNLPAQNLIQGPLPYSVVTVSASRVLGRGDSGAGAMQELTIGSGLTITGTTLSATGSGGGGGPHHTTHEPGGGDQIVGAAWTALANTFTAVQRFDSGIRLANSAAPADSRLWSVEVRPSGALRLHPLTDAGADKPTAYIDLTQAGDLSASHDLYASAAQVTTTVRWGTTIADPMVTRAGAGLEARLADNSALTTLRAKLDASDLVTGTVSDARLGINVLKYPGGYPGGTSLYLRADGTWAAPPGSGVQGDEVFIGPGDPGAAYELWFDTDETIFSGPVAAHATTHSSGGSDPVTVTALAGFPGGTANFLRADGTWAAPPGGTGGGVTDALYWVSTAHSGLSAEVSLGALASGYLKITTSAGSATPSSVVAIPQSDVTNLTTDLAAKVGGSGTAGKLSKWTSATVLGDSILSETTSSGGGGGLARAQSTSKVTANSASVVLTFATPPTVGNGIIVAVLQFGNATTAPTCTDNRGNTYALGPSRNQSSWERASILYCAAAGTTGTPFTITVTGASFQWTAIAIEVTGGIALDQSASQFGSLTTPLTTGLTPALTAADVFEVAALAIGSGMSFITVESVSPPWLQELEELPTTYCAGEVDSRSRTGVAGTTPSCTWTTQTGTEWAAVLAVFKATGGSGGTSTGVTVAGTVTATSFIGDGSQITALNASQLTTGTVPDARLSVNVLKVAGGYPGGTATFLRADGTFAAVVATGGDEVFIGTADPGAAYELWYDTDELAIDPTVLPHHVSHEAGGADEIVNINAARLTSGVIADARLSTNVPLKNASNTFTASNVFTKNFATSAHAISLQSALPLLSLVETGAPADQRMWRMFASGQALYIGACNDAETVTSAQIAIDRVGTVTVPRTLLIKGDTPFLALTDMTQAVDARAFVIQNSGGLLSIAPYNDAFTSAGWAAIRFNRNGDTLVCPSQSGSRLQFGGTTSGQPALRWNGTNLECVLADNSNWAGFRCGSLDVYSIATIAGGLNANGGISCYQTITLKDGANIPISISQNANYLRFVTTNYGQVTYMDTAGNWTLNGTLTPAGGIQFASTAQSASATCLDAYQEVVWTPTLRASGGGVPTYGLQYGLAVKIGRFVYFGGRVSISAKGSMVAGGWVAMDGLPWVVEGTYWGGAMYAGYIVATAVAAGIGGYLPPGGQYVQLTANTTGGTNLLNPDWINAGFDMIFFGSYYANS